MICKLFMQQLQQEHQLKIDDTCYCGAKVFAHEQQPTVRSSMQTHASAVAPTLAKLNLPKWSTNITAYSYLARLEQLLQISGLDSRDWCKALLMSNDDITSTAWIQAEIVGKERDWPSSKAEFLAHFSRCDRTQQLTHEYRNLKQSASETVQSYADRFTHIIGQLGYHDDSSSLVIDHFVLGLDHKIYRKLQQMVTFRREPITSLKKAMGDAIELEITLFPPSATKTHHSNTKPNQAGSRGTTTYGATSQRKHCANHPNSTSHSTAECKLKSNTSSDGASVKKPQPVCHECGGPHYVTYCPQRTGAKTEYKPKQPSSTSSSSTVEVRRSEREPKPIDRYKPGESLTNKQVEVEDIENNQVSIDRTIPLECFETKQGAIFFVLRGKAYRCLLDTGAKCTFINKDLAHQLNLTTFPVEGTITFAQSGNKIPRIAITEQLDVEVLFTTSSRDLKPHSIRHSFELLDMDQDFTLGRDLLKPLFGDSIPLEFVEDEPTPRHPVIQPRDDISIQTTLVDELMNADAQDASNMFGVLPEAERPEKMELSTEVELEATYSKQRAIIHHETEQLLQVNENITGFCNLAESIVHLDVDETKTAKLYRKQYKVKHVLIPLVNEVVDRWYDTGKIELAQPGCGFNNPLTCAPKRDSDGTITGIRVCLDTRLLNGALRSQDRFQLPYIRDALELFSGSSIYGEFDLSEAYLQFQLDPASRPYTAFTWHGRQYQSIGCPFGVACLPSVFQRVMSHIMSDFNFTFVYLDNLPFGSTSWSDHKTQAIAIIQRLNQMNLRIKPSSVKFGQSTISILGHKMSPQGISIHPSKRKMIEEWELPQTGAALQSFLGFVTFVRAHLRHVGEITAPLEAIKLNKVIEWDDHLRECFYTLKAAVASAPILKFPDFTKPFCVTTDASKSGVGGVLFQPDDDDKTVTPHNIVSIVSKKLDQAQCNYSVYKKELFSVIYCLRQFNSYLWGQHFDLFTDHKPLVYMFDTKDLSVALQQWLDVILDYSFTIHHRPGVLNVVADQLSRMYSQQYESTTWGVPPQIHFDTSCFEAPTTSVAANQTDVDVNNNVNDDPATPTPDPLGEEDAQPESFSNKQVDSASSDHAKLLVQMELKGKRCPESEVEKRKLIEHEHALGHFGRDAIYQSLYHKNWWWPKLRDDINSVLADCDACCRYTVTTAGFHPASFVTSTGPWNHIQIDCSVHLPASDDGFTTLLVIIDVFSGFALLRPIRTNSAEIIANELWSVFSIFGLPRIIQSDNGSEFVNAVVRCLVKLIGVEHRFISPYNPRADGKVERCIGSVMSIIKKLLNGTNQFWPLFTNFAQYSFNLKIASLTGSSPFSLMFGRTPTPMADHSGSEPQPVDLQDWKRHQEKILSLIYPAVATRVLDKKNKMIQQLDRHRKQLLESSIPAGTTVMLKDPIRQNKFEPKYVGPYHVVRRTRNGTYLLKDAAGDNLDRGVPIDQLKILKRKPATKKVFYEVDKILQHRGESGSYTYLTKWKGYDDDTWEPAASFMDHAPIKAYWKQQAAQHATPPAVQQAAA